MGLFFLATFMFLRLKLENLIFARATFLHAQVYSKKGALMSCAEDNLLQRLLAVYNQFFMMENQLIFGEESVSIWDCYLQGTTPYGGDLIPFQELVGELIFQKKLNKFLKEKQKNIDRNLKL